MGYDLRNITPKEMQCAAGLGCPAIYDLTPRELKCLGGIGCPAVYESSDESGSYLIVGERVDPSEFGLAEKVSGNEVLVKVSKKLIDDRGK